MPKTIMLVDDDRILTKQIKAYLENHDLDVIVAQDGEEALKKLEVMRPDLVVLDIQMPKLNGYSFLFEMRKLEQGKVPVIIFTGREEMEDVFRAEGVKEYLVKPSSPGVLLEKIRQHL